jgi:6-phosphofructokinase 1
VRIQHTIKYIDPSYTIRSAPCVASDAIFAVRLGQHACHAAMSGKTGLIVGMVRNEFVHLPMSRVTEFRKKVDIRGTEFQAFLDMSNMGLDLIH